MPLQPQTQSRKAPFDAFPVKRLEAQIIGLCAHGGDVMKRDIKYHLNAGGSRTRAKLCYYTGLAFELDEDWCLLMASCVEMLHNASLIHDDIQDEDLKRRARPALWAKVGKDRAICAGDALIIAAVQALSQIQAPNAPLLIQLTTQRTPETIRGQVRDLSHAKMTLNDYRSLASEKSASLLSLSVELPALLAGEKHAAHRLSKSACLFATAYQLIDDLADYQADALRKEPNYLNLLCQTLQKNTKLSDDACLSVGIAKLQGEVLHLLRSAEKELVPCVYQTSEPLRFVINALSEKIGA